VSSRHRQDGIALVALLWVLSGLSLIVAAGLVETRSELRLTRTHVDLAKARGMAEAGIYRGVHALLQSRETVSFGLPETPPRLAWDGIQVAIGIHNEAGKIDVNESPEALLTNMLLAAGADRAVLQRMRDRHRHARGPGEADPDLPAVTERYSSIEDFARRLQLPEPVWRRARPWITVHNGRAGVNPRVADPDVLSLLPGLEQRDPRTLNQQDSLDWLQSFAMNADQGHITDRLSPVYTITARAKIGRVSTTVRATIRMSAHRDRPYTILAWDESPSFGGA
jgi:general secretion pathway protein K